MKRLCRRFWPVVALALVSVVWFGSRRPLFRPYDAIGSSVVVSLGDVDGDRTMDVAAIDHGRDESTITLDLSSSVGPPERFAIPGEYTTIAALDVDNDGDLDLVVVSSNGPTTVFVNDGRAGFRLHSIPVGAHVGSTLVLPFVYGGATTASGSVIPPILASAFDVPRGSRQAGLAIRVPFSPDRPVTSRGPPPAACA